MELEYYEKWDPREKKPYFLLTENEAREWHAKEKPYVVLIKTNKQLKYVVRIDFDFYFCSVSYDDFRGSISESYTIEGNQLFLNLILIKKELINNSHNEMDQLHIIFQYEIDGRARKDVFRVVGNYPEYLDPEYLSEVHTLVDISKHFRNIIEFGNYESILPTTPNKVIEMPLVFKEKFYEIIDE